MEYVSNILSDNISCLCHNPPIIPFICYRRRIITVRWEANIKLKTCMILYHDSSHPFARIAKEMNQSLSLFILSALWVHCFLVGDLLGLFFTSSYLTESLPVELSATWHDVAQHGTRLLVSDYLEYCKKWLLENLVKMNLNTSVVRCIHLQSVGLVLNCPNLRDLIPTGMYLQKNSTNMAFKTEKRWFNRMNAPKIVLWIHFHKSEECIMQKDCIFSVFPWD